MSKWTCWWLLCCVLGGAMGNVAAANLDAQRVAFLQAERALEHRNTAVLHKFAASLRDYPLYPYLVYDELRPRLVRATAAEVGAFLVTYRNSLLATRLRGAWLGVLAEQQRYAEFLVEAPQPEANVELECLRREVLYKTGDTAHALENVASLWLVGVLQSPVCDRLFSLWRDAGGLPPAMVWRRIALAMDAGQTELATGLGRWLPEADRPVLKLWLRVHGAPEWLATPQHLTWHHPMMAAVIAHGIKRLARTDAPRAVAYWEQFSTHYDFNDEQRTAVRRALALGMAIQRRPEAPLWLATLDPAQGEDQQVRERRVLLAIWEGDWSGALAWLDWLNADEKQSPRWRYWHARTLETLGFTEDAERVYRSVAAGRDYYAFLAADRLGMDYALHHRPLQFTPAEMEEVATQPGIARAREFYVLHRLGNAAREWQHTLRAMNDSEVLRAAKLAQAWGWVDRAIFTMARPPPQNDLEILFPLRYRDHVVSQARAQDITAAWVYGILRQESAFDVTARSPVGALGLMQLMPATGKRVAKSLKVRLKRPAQQLLDPDTNIRFGAAYLRNVLAELYHHTVLATAAYNAGGGRVRQWLPSEGEIPADIWVEMVPFKETRDYIRRVLAYTVIYSQRLTGTPMRIATLMPPVRRSP